MGGSWDDQKFKKKKNRHFEVSYSPSLCNKEPFLHWIVTRDKKWIFYDNWQWWAQWLDQEEASNHFPKPNLHQKKRSWSLFGGPLPIWSTTAFWILTKPFYLRSMLSTLMRCNKNCKACYQHWSTERAQFFSTTMPDCMSYNEGFKIWTNCAVKFCLIWHIHLTSYQPNTISSSISATFCNQQDAENAFQEFVESWGMNF